MKLGQLLVFDSRLFHRSGHNTSSQVRYSLVGMYHDVNNDEFRPPNLKFEFKDTTPKQYFETFQGGKTFKP